MQKPIRNPEQWGPIEAKLLYMSFWFGPTAFGASKRWGAHWPPILGKFEDCRTTFVWEREEMYKGGVGVIENILIVPEKKQKLWLAYEEHHQQLRQIEKKAKSLGDNFEDAGSTALELVKVLDEAWEIGVTPELANFAAPLYFKEKLSNFIPLNETHDVLEALLAPEDLSFHQQSELELFEIANSKGKKFTVKDIKEYTEKWFWVENSYFESKRLTPEYFLSQVSSLSSEGVAKRLHDIREYIPLVLARKEDVFKKYELSADLQNLAHVLSHSIWWQDHRKGLSWWIHATIDILSSIASNKLNVSFDDIMMYRAHEWGELLTSQKRVGQSVLDSRKEMAVFLSNPEGFEEYSGAKGFSVWRSYMPESEEFKEKVSEFKGIRVSSGKVTGKVRILFSPRKVDAMQKGEILVAPMTSPDYILAMRKAAAIVTDVGGLMSHAAIVSRELKIPCIVGTKIATKVLKDGDLVEVDAEKGVVSIIKKNA